MYAGDLVFWKGFEYCMRDPSRVDIINYRKSILRETIDPDPTCRHGFGPDIATVLDMWNHFPHLFPIGPRERSQLNHGDMGVVIDVYSNPVAIDQPDLHDSLLLYNCLMVKVFWPSICKSWIVPAKDTSLNLPYICP